jgi:hypothetical protein
MLVLLQIYTYVSLRTIIHDIQSRIKYATFLGLLSHRKDLIDNTKKTVNTLCSVKCPFGALVNPLNAQLNPICHLLALFDTANVKQSRYRPGVAQRVPGS